MAYNKVNEQFWLFIRLFLILFIILFILPALIDKCLSMFMLYEAPRGGSVLVSKNLNETITFGRKFLYVLTNLILNL